MKYIKQEGIKDCGIACLYNIIKFYKGHVSMEKLRKLTNTNENGTSIYNLIKASTELGLEAKAYECELNDLSNIDFPIIAYIKLNNFYHFVIIKDIDFDKVSVFDPIRGHINYNTDDFLNEFQNIVITFNKKDNIVNERVYYLNYLKELILSNKKTLIILLIIYLLVSIIDFIYQISLRNVFTANKNIVLFIVMTLVLKLISSFFKNKYVLKFNNEIDKTLSSKVYTKLFSLPYTYYHQRPVGDITSKINDLFYVKDFINLLTSSSIIDMLLIIFILFFMCFTSFKLFIIVFVSSILYFLFNYYFQKEENLSLEELKINNSNNNSSLIDNILGIDTIKNLNIENKIINKQNYYFDNYLHSFNKYHKLINNKNLFIIFLTYYPIIFLIIKHNTFKSGELLMIYSLVITYFSSLNNLHLLYRKYIDSNISFKRLNDFLNIEITNDNKKTIKAISNIKFNNLEYSINNRKIIKNFSLNICKGDKVLISGPSGIGKSSLFKLLNKDLIVNNNSIYINDIDINDIKETSIKNNICYVSQNEYIFHDSIKNNILLYKNINSKELNKILKITMVDKLLKDRNITLDYILEENGHNLSGGDRQKILLARTLVRNIDYIILDETTSEIDTESERKIIERIFAEYNKTLVLISHRCSNEDLFTKKVFV